MTHKLVFKSEHRVGTSAKTGKNYDFYDVYLEMDGFLKVPFYPSDPIVKALKAAIANGDEIVVLPVTVMNEVNNEK